MRGNIKTHSADGAPRSRDCEERGAVFHRQKEPVGKDAARRALEGGCEREGERERVIEREQLRSACI